MKHLKQLLCLALIACLALSIVPAQVFARGTVTVAEDVNDAGLLAGNQFYIASTAAQYAENTPTDYLIRIGRGGNCAAPASVTVKTEDFSAHYGKDYTVSVDGKKIPCPEDAIAITDLLMGDYTVTRQMTEEEAAADEDLQQEQTEAMAQATELLRELTGIEEGQDAPLSALEQARAAQTGVTAPQQRLTATDQTEEQMQQLTALMGDLVPGASMELQFAAGETEKYLTVHPVDNREADGDRYFTIRLTNAVGAEVSSADSCSVSVIDDEEITPCEVSFGEITQSGDTLTVNIERTGCINQITHLKLTTKPGGVEPDSTVQWSNFRTAVTDDDIYVVWTQPVDETAEEVELYASALIRSNETENCGADWSNPYRLTYDGRITDTPYLAVNADGDMIAVYNSYKQEITEDPENPLIVSDLKLCAATLVPCGAVEVEEIDVTDLMPEAGQTLDISLTLVNNGLTFAEGYELNLYAGDTLIETFTTKARMRPAQRTRFSFSWTVPEDFEGMTVRAVVKELGGAWTNTHERETESLRKDSDLEILEPMTYQDETGFRMSFNVANYGNAASTDKDTFMLSQVGPYASDCGLSLDEKTFAELSLAGIAAGEKKHFDIAVNVPEKAFEQFGYVSCIAEIYKDGELKDYTSVDLTPKENMAVSWSGGELPDAIGLNVGETMAVSISTVPAAEQVILYSSNPTVVSVEDGKITAVGSGSAEITGIILPSGETFGPIPVIIKPYNPFIDVAEKDWFYNSVMEAYDKGLMVGVTDNTFEPDGTMSRAMLVTVLHRMQGSPAPAGTASFTDVKAGKWYTDAVLWAAENGIVSGIGNGKFAPNDSVTREQFAAILYRFADWYGENTAFRAELDFSDAGNVSKWAKDSVQWAVAMGLLSGKLNNGVTLLDPLGSATRAEGSSILIRFLTNILRQ